MFQGKHSKAKRHKASKFQRLLHFRGNVTKKSYGSISYNRGGRKKHIAKGKIQNYTNLKNHFLFCKINNSF